MWVEFGLGSLGRLQAFPSVAAHFMSEMRAVPEVGNADEFLSVDSHLDVKITDELRDDRTERETESERERWRERGRVRESERERRGMKVMVREREREGAYSEREKKKREKQ